MRNNIAPCDILRKNIGQKVTVYGRDRSIFQGKLVAVDNQFNLLIKPGEEREEVAGGISIRGRAVLYLELKSV